MNTFSYLYIFDLHGNSKKKETPPDGYSDKNVFDIQQGVAILVGVKRAKASSDTCQVRRSDIWGSRQQKYDFLVGASLEHEESVLLTPTAPEWLFAHVDKSTEATYAKFFGIDELFSQNGRPAPGIVTTHDQFAISLTKEAAERKVETLLSTNDETEARGHFRLCTQDQWSYQRAKAQLSVSDWKNHIVPISYRPFDTRFTVYDSNVAVHRRERVMHHFMRGPNVGLLTTKACRDANFAHVFVTNKISEAIFLSGSTATNAMNLPLYLYPDEGDFDQTVRVNLDDALYSRPQTISDHPQYGIAGELDVFDYVYGVLHCPQYRTDYAAFLRNSFPRIPWPVNSAGFWDVATKGSQLRKLHLMDILTIGATPFPFVGEGDNVVASPHYENGRPWVNDTQSFDAVPFGAWDHFIGGYQPAQKWLKDRKGRALSFDDVKHYQRILKVLSETKRIMDTIEVTAGT